MVESLRNQAAQAPAAGCMRILVHDYSGHPFPVQLSRELARRGHQVTHCFDADFVTPHGNLSVQPTDPPRFSVSAVTAGGPLAKHALLKRWQQERAYGRELARFILAQAPDVVLSGNTPLGSQALALQASRRAGARFVYWLQDLYGIGIERALRARIPLAGTHLGRHFIRTERRLLRASDGVVAISTDFTDYAVQSGVERRRLEVIENWGPVADFKADDNEITWKERHGLEGKFVFLYSGTLGLKHNPELLASVARAFASHPEVAVVVASEGVGAEWLRAHRRSEGLTNLQILDFQPYPEVPEMLRAADVLMAILEPAAGEFSVPSKVLTYMCAGRPILGAIPAETLAARTLRRANCGVVVDPSNPGEFVNAARKLWGSADFRQELGDAGRRHAEQRFRIEGIASRFEAVLAKPPSGPKLAREAV